MTETILIVDDEPAQLRMAEYAIQQKLHYRAITAGSGEEGIQWVLSGRRPQPDLMLLDLAMPGTNGVQVIRAVKAYRPQLPIIVLTQYGDDEHAAQAVQAGANDFLSKPVVLDRLRLSIQNALKICRMTDAIARLERKVAGHVGFPDIIGESPRLKEALAVAESAASSRMPVWIEGEYGTGKELLARAIHGSSDRAGKPFVVVDCASLQDEAAEATLFGQEKLSGRLHFALGKLREADHGTLFLKSVNALKAPLQHRLLEVLEEQAVRALGASTAMPLDLRLISSVQESVEPLIAQGSFSHMLYRRLKGMAIALPTLRERKQDVPLLAQHFASQYAAAERKYIHGLTDEALQHLASGSWPGNVRQLAQLLWRAVMVSDGDMIDADDLRTVCQPPALPYAGAPDGVPGAMPALLDMQGHIKKLKVIEEEAIRFALRYSGGCMTRAARSLGIGRSTLYRRVNELALDDYIARANHMTRPMMKVSSIDRS